MFRDKIPLPEKIRESGEGYTLSGKPLDPNSAAAKPYLNRNGSISGPAKTVNKVVKEKKDDPMEGVEHDIKPAQDGNEVKTVPVDDGVKPTDDEVKPVDSEVKSVDSEVKPVDSEVKPMDSEVKPMDNEVKPTPMEIDTKEVETQTKELSIGEDKKTPISELKETGSVKSASPSPSNSST